MPTVNGDGAELPKMVTLKPIPTVVLKKKKKLKKTGKKTVTAQAIPEVIPINQYIRFLNLSCSS